MRTLTDAHSRTVHTSILKLEYVYPLHARTVAASSIYFGFHQYRTNWASTFSDTRVMWDTLTRTICGIRARHAVCYWAPIVDVVVAAIKRTHKTKSTRKFRRDRWTLLPPNWTIFVVHFTALDYYFTMLSKSLWTFFLFDVASGDGCVRNA